jgi:hypothetical protein
LSARNGERTNFPAKTVELDRRGRGHGGSKTFPILELEREKGQVQCLPRKTRQGKVTKNSIPDPRELGTLHKSVSLRIRSEVRQNQIGTSR